MRMELPVVRHSFYAFFPGISARTYTDEQLRQINEESEKIHTWHGKEYNAYQASQQQRKMETKMRAQRAEVKALQRGDGSKDDIMAAQSQYLNTLHQYQAFSEKMGLPEQMERVYMDGLGRVASGKFSAKSIVSNAQSDIIKSKEMLRKTQNTGAFKHLSERMSKKHIREIAKEFGIETEGLTLNIDFNEELLRIPLAGRADSENLGGITFFPNSFRNKEELVRTLFHEKQHVSQFREFGVEYVQENRLYFEKLTETLEEEFVSRLKKEGKL